MPSVAKCSRAALVEGVACHGTPQYLQSLAGK